MASTKKSKPTDGAVDNNDTEVQEWRMVKTTELPEGGKVEVAEVRQSWQNPNYHAGGYGARFLYNTQYEVNCGQDKTLYLSPEQTRELKRILSSF